MMQQMVLAIVGIIVGIILLTATASTVSDNTGTSDFYNDSLENVSATAKTIYGLYDFLYALLGIGLIIGGFVVFFKGAGVLKR